MGSLTKKSLMVRCCAHLSNLALGSFILSLRLVEVISVHKEIKLEVKRDDFFVNRDWELGDHLAELVDDPTHLMSGFG